MLSKKEKRLKDATYRKSYRSQPHVIEKGRDDYLRKKYNISSEDFKRRFAAQGNCCAICKTKTTGIKGRQWFDVDHIHGTKIVRGILCKNCNVGLGCFFDIPELLEEAIRYLLCGEELQSEY